MTGLTWRGGLNDKRNIHREKDKRLMPVTMLCQCDMTHSNNSSFLPFSRLVVCLAQMDVPVCVCVCSYMCLTVCDCEWSLFVKIGFNFLKELKKKRIETNFSWKFCFRWKLPRIVVNTRSTRGVSHDIVDIRTISMERTASLNDSNLKRTTTGNFHGKSDAKTPRDAKSNGCRVDSNRQSTKWSPHKAPCCTC